MEVSTIYKIIDWAGNRLEAHGSFKSWEDAEEHLCIFLDDSYETDRGEYYIVREIDGGFYL